MPPKHPKIEPIRNPTLFEMDKLEQAGRLVNSLNVERPYSEPGLLLGTSAFTANGWLGAFYPPAMKPRDFLSYHSRQFQTVEIDSTYYRAPSASTVTNWYERTPPDFIFAAKVPHVITHEKVYNVALALTDISRMPRPWEKKKQFDWVTTEFVYVRWLGDRKGMETLTTTWNKTIITELMTFRTGPSYSGNSFRGISRSMLTPTTTTPGMLNSAAQASEITSGSYGPTFGVI